MNTSPDALLDTDDTTHSRGPLDARRWAAFVLADASGHPAGSGESRRRERELALSRHAAPGADQRPLISTVDGPLLASA